MLLSIYSIIWITTTIWRSQANLCDKMSTTQIRVLETSSAQLPCDLSEGNNTNDKLQLIFWYKESSNNPFYSIDVRNKSFNSAHHMLINIHRGRMFFNNTNNTNQNNAFLFIQQVQVEDEGNYCCRVDFQNLPTRYYAINLAVIVLPLPPVISNQDGVQLASQTSAYNEGQPLYLSCKVEGGRPLPSVTWWHDAIFVNNTRHVVSSGVVRNDLTILSLNRDQFRTIYTCKASNTNLTSPTSTSITIEMNLKPVQVKIERQIRPLSAGKKSQIKCQSIGSRPEPIITWWLGQRKLTSTTQYTTLDQNKTISVLTFQPTSTDNGKHLICKAENPKIPNTNIQDDWSLNIYYIPVVTIGLTSPLNQNNILQGNDVYLECQIASNPFVFTVKWKHKSRELVNNASYGIIMTAQSLVIQSVQPQHVGPYVCVAINTQGEGESEPFHLKIRYKPVCKADQQMKYSYVYNQTVEIKCQLQAYPTNVTFHWTSSTAKGTKTLVPFETRLTNSSVLYSVNSDSDLGTVSCWGTNEIATQSQHCLFQIVMAEEPQVPENCTLFNISDTSFQVNCLAKIDLSLSLNFTLQLYHDGDSQLITTLTSTNPRFNVTKLKPVQSYLLKLFASNIKGNSAVVEMTATTLQTDNSLNDKKKDSSVPEWHISTAFLGCLLILVVVTIVILKIKTIYKIKEQQQLDLKMNQSYKTPLYINEENEIIEIEPEEITYISHGIFQCWRNVCQCCKQHRIFNVHAKTYDYQDQINPDTIELTRPPYKWRKVKFEENLETIVLTNSNSDESSSYKHERKQSWIEMNF